MLFIVLTKFKVTPTRETVAEADKSLAGMEEMGVRIKAVYWTLGMFDAISIIEA
ncbi:MAG: hypothetical protein ACE5KH_00545 [Candidatus Geothermarchaeales archaeon]